MAEHQPPQHHPEPGKLTLDPREILALLWGQKWLIVGATVLVTTALVFWTLRQPKIYEAVCSLQYDPNPARPLGRDVDDINATWSNFWATKEFYATQNRILESRTLAERVVLKLNLHRNAAFMGVAEEDRDNWSGATPEAAARRMGAMVKVEQESDSRIVELRVRDQNPERAALIANTLAREYIDKTQEDRLRSTRDALTWLQEQLDNLENELEGTEGELHQFMESNDILSVSLQDRQNIVAGRIAQLSSALTGTSARRIELSARLTQLRAANRDNPLEVHASFISSDDAIQELRTRHRVKSAERDALSSRYGPSHPAMQQLDAEITRILEDMRVAIDGLISRVERDLREVRSTESGLQASLNESHGRGLELNQLEIHHTRLKRKRDNGENLVKMLLERTAETNLNKLVEVSNGDLVDVAVVPRTHVAPRMSINAALGLVGGLLLGLAIAILRTRMDRRLRSVEDAEALGLTVLGVLPKIDTTSASRPKYGTRRRPLREVQSDNKDLIVHLDPHSTAAECSRSIRTNLTFMAASEPLNAIVVTSPGPREGKTTVAMSLAISLAHGGKRVLLVDTDLRRPRVHRAFGLSGQRGVTTVLIGEDTIEQAAQPSVVTGLDVLACGPIPPNPAELLQSAAFAKFAARAREIYDFVLFDSPPVTVVTDAAIIAPQLQGTLLVCRAGATTRDAMRSALRQLKDVGATVLGGVLNDVDFSDRYGSAYYYYRAGGYYGADEDSGDSVAAAPPAAE